MRFTRVTLFFIAFIITLGFYQLTRHFLAEVEPQTFQATEEVLVDISHLLAESVELEMEKNVGSPEDLRIAFSKAHGRVFNSKIFDHVKTRVGINAYVTDPEGIVVFDSETGRFKRGWGAYGIPLDQISNADPAPYVPPNGPGAPRDKQFRSPLHCAGWVSTRTP